MHVLRSGRLLQDSSPRALRCWRGPSRVPSGNLQDPPRRNRHEQAHGKTHSGGIGRKRGHVGDLVIALLLLAAGQPMPTPQQGSLTGETIEGVITSARFNDSNCSILVVQSLATVATGPYPGTASVEIEAGFNGPNAEGLMPFLYFRDSFTIWSGDTVITGTKTLAPGVSQTVPTATSYGLCTKNPGDEFFDQIHFRIVRHRVHRPDPESGRFGDE